MSARPLPVLLSAAALALSISSSSSSSFAALAATSTPAGTASESGNPINDQGSSFDYRSSITGVTPNVPGLSLEVLEFADRLLLRNHTGKTVTIYGYQGEPYARVLANGTAEQNTRSPAAYLNTSFYGNVTVPASANPSAPPHWMVVDRTGQFEWHDHRIHWMSPLPPPQVKDKSKRTLIFNWQVPIRVGTQAGAVNGQLFWTPESSRASTVVIVLGVAIALLGVLFVLFVRRRRARAGTSLGGASGGGASPSIGVAPGAAGAPEDSREEAW
ncbi:MAG TPA: hypothetical protein VGH60_11075 [Solirubrobacteraceae bacterium]|jgi:hypothetical protein